MKKYIIISGFNILDGNRGTAALGYGSISFLREKDFLKENQELLNIQFVLKFWNKKYRNRQEDIKINGRVWKRNLIFVFGLEKMLFDKFGIILPFTTFGRAMRNVEFVAAINGGDGFSDIYSTPTFLSRLPDTLFAMKLGIPVIQLPQTLGPFQDKTNYELAKRILQYSQKVYVRDDKFVKELDAMGVSYEQTIDLSAYMHPEPWNIEIKPGAVGINVSGLAYSNKFRTLSGQFEQYPYLINKLIESFQLKQIPVYLIPHSYVYGNPKEDDDDIVACNLANEALQSKEGVTFVDKNLISPQVKYVISKMTYFIGTRMHANFAAIYTGVPLYGLAYSYKFEGAFRANGVYDNNVSMINNITKDEADAIVTKVIENYERKQNII